MSIMYDNYLAEHIANVQKGLQWMADTISLPEISEMSWSMAIEKAQSHDESKTCREEYDAYDLYFYGKNRTSQVKEDFDYAWLHHQKMNPHHWQYWVLINDEPSQIVALQMPVCYVLEMIADWWSFSWKKGDLTEIFSWYDEHKDLMILSIETRILVDHILEEMRKVLVGEEVVEHSIAIRDIPEETWNELREDYQDELAVMDYIDEDELSCMLAVSRKRLEHKDNDKEYGVPEQKKFPLPDADHVRSAIRFFNYVDPKYEQELADAINEKIEEYGMEGLNVGEGNRFKKYIKKEFLKENAE